MSFPRLSSHPRAQFLISLTSSAANLYFLALVVVQVFPVFGAPSPQLSAFPLLFILAVTAIKDGIEDYRRAVLDEEVDRLFVTRDFEPDRYMLCTARVRPEARHTVEGIVHEDDSARIQTVRPDLAPGFHRLLTGVRERTGAGVTVNTSFNVKGQPLIMDPATAIDTFAGIALDRLYIEGFVVEGSSK